jgi:predicted dehydrogenase
LRNRNRSERLSRRAVLKSAAAGAIAAPWLVPASALGRDGSEAASERVTLGAIGLGNRGTYNMRRLAHYGGQIVAVADPKTDMRNRALQWTKVPASGAYNDFRDLLARDDVDAVMVATPDHWHVPIGIAAIEAGKDLYLEKPMGITVEENQAMLKAVKQSDRIFMHGTEQRGMPDVRYMCELVRNGRLGKLQKIIVACPGGQATGEHPTLPVPEGFDYDLWLGPAPKAPYNALRCIPPNHFFISDYSPSGFVCSWGIHHIDIAQWGHGTDDTYPVEIDGRGTYPESGLFDTPLTWKIEYTYADGVKMIFTDTSQNPQGVRFVGSEGEMFKAYRKPIEAKPASILESKIGPDEIHLYETDSDDHCFLNCVKSREETCSPIDVAHHSTTIGYIGHISMKLGRKLRWSPEKEVFIDDDEANKLLSRPMRGPWSLEV